MEILCRGIKLSQRQVDAFTYLINLRIGGKLLGRTRFEGMCVRARGEAGCPLIETAEQALAIFSCASVSELRKRMESGVYQEALNWLHRRIEVEASTKVETNTKE